MKGVNKFIPNSIIHPQFADGLKKAHDFGVKIICMECEVTPDEIFILDYVPVEL